MINEILNEVCCINPSSIRLPLLLRSQFDILSAGYLLPTPSLVVWSFVMMSFIYSLLKESHVVARFAVGDGMEWMTLVGAGRVEVMRWSRRCFED